MAHIIGYYYGFSWKPKKKSELQHTINGFFPQGFEINKAVTTEKTH